MRYWQIFFAEGADNRLEVACKLYVHIMHVVKLGNKEWFDKELSGIKEPFPVTNLPFTL